MTTLDYLYRHTLPAAYDCLPVAMRSDRASAMLLAIALQESGVEHRVQVNGPARGFWQFEVAGVAGVRGHRSTRDHLEAALGTLCYTPTLPASTLQRVIENNDVLACVFARLLLWTLPEALPESDNPDEAWRQYLAAWRPGRPHRERWDGCFDHAWDLVTRETT